jgi:hypothetical protein
MITVDTLRRCAWLDTITLEMIIRKNYPKDTVLAADFVGISNGGQFVYNVAFPGEDGVEKAKVFVWQDNDGELVADY